MDTREAILTLRTELSIKPYSLTGLSLTFAEQALNEGKDEEARSILVAVIHDLHAALKG